MDIQSEIKDSFKHGSITTKFIYLNLAVFILIKLVYVVFFLFGQHELIQSLATANLAVPAYLPSLITKPWTLITYQFLHFGFLHILFNLLWLYWFGRVFLQYFTAKQFTAIYLLGGIAGAGLYILFYNIFPVFASQLSVSSALGASAAVMAIAIAVSFYVPDYTFNLLFIGPVKIKWIALIFIITDVLTLADGNAGGHIAHLGGAIFGMAFAASYRKGTDITKGFNSSIDAIASLFKTKPKMKVTRSVPKDDKEYNYIKKQQHANIDHILDKISKNGYESLSKEEKEILFKQSK